MVQRPGRDEYYEYYHTYVGKVPDGDVLDILRQNGEETVRMLAAASEDKGNFRYEAGKWSLKQVLGHVCDVERLFTYRAMSFARGDKTALPGMEQDDWVAGANFDDRLLQDMVREFGAIRDSTLAFFAGLDDAAWARGGKASGFDFTVRAIAYIVAGHEIHHASVIAERYLP